MKSVYNFGLRDDPQQESSERVKVYFVWDAKFVSEFLEKMQTAHLNNREKVHIWTNKSLPLLLPPPALSLLALSESSILH